jgi:hypothetical protein
MTVAVGCGALARGNSGALCLVEDVRREYLARVEAPCQHLRRLIVVTVAPLMSGEDLGALAKDALLLLELLLQLALLSLCCRLLHLLRSVLILLHLLDVVLDGVGLGGLSRHVTRVTKRHTHVQHHIHHYH